jgi:1-acyl-sn-glycerol-3-phosphate acyltransferase
VRLPTPRLNDPLLRAARRLAGLARAYHRASLDGAANLPSGPALLVGNHGLFGLETPILFYLIHHATGRLPIGLTDRHVFGSGPIRSLLGRIGGVPGTPENALALFRDGHIVVCYPGGSREVFKRPHQRYQLAWDRADGFARLALRAGVAVVPFAGLGVDESFVNLGPLEIVERALGRYAVPLAIGLGPLPLPVRFRFRIGRPLVPPADEGEVPSFKARVRRRVERLLRAEVPYGQASAESTAVVP